MANQEVKIRISTDASGAVTGFRTVRDEMSKTDSHSGSLVSRIKTHWMGLSAAVYAAGSTISKGWELMGRAADYQERLGGIAALGAQYDMTATQIVRSMTDASRGLLSMADAADMAARSLNIGLSPVQMAEYTKVAEQLSDVTGQTIPEAYEKMVTAAAKGRVKSLAEMGIMVDLEQSYQKHADAIGVDVKALTELEKQQVRLNVVLEAGKAKIAALGPPMDSNRDKMDRLTASLKDLQLLLGQGLIRVLAGTAGLFQTVAGAALSLFGKIMKLGQGYAWLREKMSFGDESKMWAGVKDSFRMDAEASVGASNELWEKAKDNFAVMVASTDELAGASAKKMPSVIGAENALADAAKRAAAALQEQAKQSIKTAQDDVKNLTLRLSEYQKYYDSLKAMMEKNIESERKHLAELQTIRQQRVDVDKSTADLIAGIRGSNESMSMQERYDSARSGLNQQFSNALDLGGQDRVKALEDYKQAVASLQSQFSNGIPGVKDIFGNVDEVVRAKTIAEDAISDIERATQMQKNALAALAEEKQAQIEADQLWGQTLQTEAQRAQGEMQNLQNIIAAITQQITSIQTTIALTGVDNVTSVVDEIARSIQALHELAARPIAIGGGGGMMSDGGSVMMSDGGSYADGNVSLYGTGWDSSSPDIPSYATGTPYVPRTGLYRLHQGEAVIPAEQNKSGRGGVNINGDIIINVPQSAVSGKPEDWRMITRQYIVPELRKLQ